MASVVQVVSALQDSRSAATADVEAKRAAASKRAKRDKTQRAMLLHSDSAAAAASGEDPSASQPKGSSASREPDGATAGGVAADGVAADTAASMSHEQHQQVVSAASSPGKNAGRQKKPKRGSEAPTSGTGSKAGAKSSAPKRKRGPGTRLPAALGRDAGGEDVVAALQKGSGQ